MLKRWKIEVVDFGPSLHDEDSYFLVRSFTNLKNREQQEDAFYGSTEWKNGPREAILKLIDHFTTVVLPANQLNQKQIKMNQPNDLNELRKLDDQYIKKLY